MMRHAPELELRIEWQASGEPGTPYRAEVSGQPWVIRINDFPDEPMYTLFVADDKRLDSLALGLDRAELALARHALPRVDRDPSLRGGRAGLL